MKEFFFLWNWCKLIWKMKRWLKAKKRGLNGQKSFSTKWIFVSYRIPWTLLSFYITWYVDVTSSHPFFFFFRTFHILLTRDSLFLESEETTSFSFGLRGRGQSVRPGCARAWCTLCRLIQHGNPFVHFRIIFSLK